MTQPHQQDERPANPWIVTLTLAGVGAIVLAGVLALIALGQADDYLADLEALAALNKWSDFLLGAGVVALVGAFVVAGVEWTLRHAQLRA